MSNDPRLDCTNKRVELAIRERNRASGRTAVVAKPSEKMQFELFAAMLLQPPTDEAVEQKAVANHDAQGHHRKRRLKL
jgi:hypothetical protein